ncbi:hypothetical protein N302_01350, partial [Corvus brachyrhynchos]
QKSILRYRLRFASLFQLSLSETTAYSRVLRTPAASPLEKGCSLPRDGHSITK